MDLKLYHRVLFGEIFGLVSDSDKGLFVITFWRKLESNEILESGAFEPAEIAEKDLTLCLEALNLTDLFVLDFLFWSGCVLLACLAAIKLLRRRTSTTFDLKPLK